jgi:transposase
MGKKGPKQPPRMSEEEKRLARQMHFDKGLTPTEIADKFDRHVSSIARLLAQKKKPNPMGRPKKLSGAQVKKLTRTMDAMVAEADGAREITVTMVKRKARIKASVRTVADAVHSQGYRFRKLRQKPLLTPEDVKDRYAFAKKYKTKTGAWRLQNIHAHLDNHRFQVATTHAGRKLLARRTVRGVYRKTGTGLQKGHVKAGEKMRQNTGSKGALIAGGVGEGGVVIWHLLEGSWCAESAADFYQNVVAPDLKKKHPRTTAFNILEDNDPTGNRSTAGIKAKKDNKLKTFTIPKRSPDLNVMDYAVWSEVERRMRRAERKWKADKRETRKEFIARLNRTAKRLPAEFVNKSIKDMRRRCERLDKAKGGLFEEGGRKQKTRRPL